MKQWKADALSKTDANYVDGTSYLWAERDECSNKLVSDQIGVIGKPVGTVRSVVACLAANLVH